MRVKRNECVAVTANAVKQVEMIGWAELVGAAKHQVLEQMRKSMTFRRLVTTADMIPNLHCSQRSVVVLKNQNSKLICEYELRDGKERGRRAQRGGQQPER